MQGRNERKLHSLSVEKTLLNKESEALSTNRETGALRVRKLTKLTAARPLFARLPAKLTPNRDPRLLYDLVRPTTRNC